MIKFISLIIILFSFFNLKANDNDYPKYLLNGKDTIGVIFTVKQAQQIDNDYDLLDILTKMKFECDSLQKYWIQINDENGKLISLFKLKASQQDSLLQTRDDEILNLKQQIDDHLQIEKTMDSQIQIKKQEVKNLESDNRKLKVKSIFGWTGTTVGFAGLIAVITYVGIKFGFK